jgi:hypothetical protein
LQFAKHESVVSVQRAFRRQFQSCPPSANSVRCWYQQFQGNVQDVRMRQKKVWHEWDSLFFAVRRNLCAMRVVNWRCRLWLCEGCCERDWKWSPVVFTWYSFFNHFGTRCIRNVGFLIYVSKGNSLI